VQKQKAETGTAKRWQLCIRVPQENKQRLADFKHATGFSTTRVVEELLTYFWSLRTDEQRRDLVKGVRLAELDEALEQLGWADHAFGLRRWIWALEEYRSLEQIPGRKAAGLRRLAQYKQAFCFLDIAAELRRAGFTGQADRRVEYLSAAIKAIKCSIALGLRYISDTPHRVVRFNIACGWSLAAQYEIESAIVNESTLKVLKDALSHPDHQRRNEADEMAWKAIGVKWRTLRAKDGRVLHETTVADVVADRTRQAMANLRSMTEPEKVSLLPKAFHFLRDLADEDPDLRFLRCDSKAKPELTKWRTENLTDPLVAFDTLLSGLPKEVLSRSFEDMEKG